MIDLRTNSLLRWFLLLWIGLVYVAELLTVPGQLTKGVGPFVPCQISTGGNQGSIQAGCPPPLLVLLLFTLLLLAYSFLLWAGLSGKISRRFYGLYFLLQWGLLLAVSLLTQLDGLVLSLALALTLGGLAMLRRVRPVLLVTGGSLALLFISDLLNGVFSGKTWSNGASLLFEALASINATALVLFVLGYLLLYVQQASAHRELAAAHRQLAAAAARIEELTLVTERQRMARELHDTLAQGLAGVILQLEAVEEVLTLQQPEHAQQVVGQAKARAKTTLAEARQAITALRTSTPEASLCEAVQAEITRFTTATGIACHADPAALMLIPASLAEQVLRMIAEGLSNVARHAQAHQVWITVSCREETLVIEVRDDGLGFDPAQATEQPGHFGLLGLRERARLASGRFEITSAAGAGTILHLSLPRPKEGAPRWET
jgi:NarL family two-component system sensor histidine kinase YdfH